jgi:hypothetical protein
VIGIILVMQLELLMDFNKNILLRLVFSIKLEMQLHITKEFKLEMILMLVIDIVKLEIS